METKKKVIWGSSRRASDELADRDDDAMREKFRLRWARAVIFGRKNILLFLYTLSFFFLLCAKNTFLHSFLFCRRHHTRDDGGAVSTSEQDTVVAVAAERSNSSFKVHHDVCVRVCVVGKIRKKYLSGRTEGWLEILKNTYAG